MNVALIGNPNCGKTTLFNVLTGTYNKVGNWSGVTTEAKFGKYKKDKSVNVVDLPGLYALSAASKDEAAVLDYLKNSPPDCIIDVLDGTNLERNLYLTCRLAKLGIPMLIAVNFFDELSSNGISFNAEALRRVFGVPVVCVSALKNYGIDRLMSSVLSGKSSVPKPVNAVGEDYYSFIGKIIGGIIVKKPTRAEIFTEKADRVLLHRVWGIPVFLCVVFVVFFCTVKIGGAVGELLCGACESLAELLSEFLIGRGAHVAITSLICNGIIGGVGSVLSFLPQLLVLFFLLTLIEQSGYSARAAFLLDDIFCRIGLGGSSFIPMFLSCGCTATAATATRTIEDDGERRLTLFLSPFIPCGAKLAVYVRLSEVLFGRNALLPAITYVLAFFCVAVLGKVLKKTGKFGVGEKSFIAEIPTLRRPSFKDVFSTELQKIKDFLFKAGTIILTVSVTLWFLRNFGLCGYTSVVEESFLYYIGNSLKYLFIPLGFGSWEATVSVLSGILAKEAISESLILLSSDVGCLFDGTQAVYAFAAFILLSPPCAAALGVIRGELKSKKTFAAMLAFQFISAYVAAFSINVVGTAINRFGYLIFLPVVVIMISIKIIHAPVGGGLCGRCDGGAKCKRCRKRNTTI